MKKMIGILSTVLLLAGVLTGCGGPSTAKEQEVDLSAFWAAEVEKYQWNDDRFADLDEEMLESYYQGLKDIETSQLITKVPMMSSVVQEMVFAEAATEEDAGKLAEILQKRVDDQASGGAWYPESMEAWKKAEVVTQGRYVALVASAENQDEIVDDFNALFSTDGNS